MVKMELKFWNSSDRRHLPIKLLRLGFGCKQSPDLPENGTLLPNVIFMYTFSIGSYVSFCF